MPKPEQHTDINATSPFYSRKQGNYTFAFYIEGGYLKAVVCGRDKAEQASSLKGISVEWQNGLDNAEKAAKVKRALDESFFTYQGSTVSVNLRGLGGWGDNQHRGYDGADEDAGEPGLWACIRLKGFDENSQRYPVNGGRGAQGTFQWAIDTGLIGERGLMAARIGYYANDVDYHGGTRPTHLDHIPQGWHFNVSRNDTDGSKGDSRLVHALNNLVAAIGLRRQGSMAEAFNTLGRGLHALQDIFAHTAAFVEDFEMNAADVLHWRFQFHRGQRADNPNYIDPGKSPKSKISEPEFDGHELSQRYSDTKTMTYLYLLLFRLATEPAFLSSGEYYRIIRQLNLVSRIANSNQGLFSVPVFITEFRNNLQQAGLGIIVGDSALFMENQLPMSSTLTSALQDERKRFLSIFTDAVDSLKHDVEIYSIRAFHCAKKPAHHGVAELSDMREFSDLAMKTIVQCQVAITAEKQRLDEQTTGALANGRAHFVGEMRGSLQTLQRNMTVYKKRADDCCRSGVGELPDMRSYSANALAKIRQCLSNIETQSASVIRTTIGLIGQDVTVCKARALGCCRSKVAELPDMRIYSAQAAINVEQCLAIAGLEEQRVSGLHSTLPLTLDELHHEVSDFVDKMHTSLGSIRGAIFECCANAYKCCKTDMGELSDMRLLSDSGLAVINQCFLILENERACIGNASLTMSFSSMSMVVSQSAPPPSVIPPSYPPMVGATNLKPDNVVSQLASLMEEANTRLLSAAIKNDTVEIKRAIADGVTSVVIDKSATSNGWNSLHWLAWHGNQSAMETILVTPACRIAINNQTAGAYMGGLFGRSGAHSALHIVAYQATYARDKKIAMMQLLLRSGANPNLLDSAKRKALPDEYRTIDGIRQYLALSTEAPQVFASKL